MNAMHTPGPWHVDPDASICVSGPDGNVALMNLARPKAVSEANARLIASAPELLAVARKALDAWTGDGPPIALDELRAAIAKATGAA